MDRENTCAAADELLPEYIAGTLGASDKYLVLAHLALCSECRKTAAGLIALKRELNSPPMLSDVPEDVLAHAFGLLPKKEPTKTDAVKKTRDTLKNSYDTVADALHITHSSLKLVLQFII